AIRMISFSSVFRAAWTAAIELSRPTDNGNNSPGNNTVFFRGNAGSDWNSVLVFAITLSYMVRCNDTAISCDSLRLSHSTLITYKKARGQDFFPFPGLVSCNAVYFGCTTTNPVAPPLLVVSRTGLPCAWAISRLKSATLVTGCRSTAR